MTDREAIELMVFFFAVAAACQVWLWTVKKATTKRGSGSPQSPRQPRALRRKRADRHRPQQWLGQGPR